MAEQAAMDARVQRLDAPVHHLGEAGDVGDLAAPAGRRRASALRGAAGRDELDAALARARAANSTSPVLSDTEISARVTRRRCWLMVGQPIAQPERYVPLTALLVTGL